MIKYIIGMPVLLHQNETMNRILTERSYHNKNIVFSLCSLQGNVVYSIFDSPEVGICMYLTGLSSALPEDDMSQSF